ncbi:leucine Rich Repeat domain-containing protein [Phlyctema vagabunda]|uniref:Leucine Rich Repeat domain-containing protein n=1 Tax=Phlyctema vagabunda TaxID=108571 RepID=A0ABR4P9K3_9HELO
MSSVLLQNKMAATTSVLELPEPAPVQRPAHLERLPNELLRKLLSPLPRHHRAEAEAEAEPKIGPGIPTDLLLPPGLGTEALAQHAHPYDDIQHDLLSCLLTSQKLHATAIPLVYRHVRFSKASTFAKFLAQLTRYPALGQHVQSLDLSELGRLQAIAADDLLRCLTLTPLLRTFLAPPHLEPHVDVLRRVLGELPQLTTLSFKNCTSTAFTEAFANLFDSQRDVCISPSITDLNLHGCGTLESEIFEILLPALPRLQKLDIGCTNTPSSALLSLATTVRLTELNMDYCANLSSRPVVRFLTTHAAVQHSLVALSANTRAMHEDAVFSEEDLSRLLAQLPRSLKSLHVKTSMMTPEHLPLLQRLARQLEELSVGSDLRLADLECLFLPKTDPTTTHTQAGSYPEPRTPVTEDGEASKSSLSQAVAVCKLHQRLSSISASSEDVSPPWTIKRLDLSSMSIFQQRKILTSFLLGLHSLPLTRIQIGEEVYVTCKSLTRVCAAVDWIVTWDGRRCFLSRK